MRTKDAAENFPIYLEIAVVQTKRASMPLWEDTRRTRRTRRLQPPPARSPLRDSSLSRACTGFLTSRSGKLQTVGSLQIPKIGSVIQCRQNCDLRGDVGESMQRILQISAIPQHTTISKLLHKCQ